MNRRLTAIAVADVVGYSRLMAQDEAGTLAALKARRKLIVEPTVREHGGRIVKVMGDGVLMTVTRTGHGRSRRCGGPAAH